MPWTVGDVEGFNKSLTDAEKERWVGAANGYLKTCLDDGGSAETCEASAIKIANAAVQESRHEITELGERILEAVFDEHATVKATVQGFLRAAHAIAKHPNVPAKFKKRVEEIRADLASHKWADMVGDDSGGTPEAVGASEAIREALQSIARKQVRDRLREVDLGGVSISEFETKLRNTLRDSLGGAANVYVVDLFEGMVAFSFEGMYDALWGAPYKINPDGSITVGKPIRVKRTCRYIPDEVGTEKPPEDRGDQPGGQSELPEDWWKYSQYWPNDGNKALGGGSPAESPSQGQEALREEGAIVEADSGSSAVEFIENGCVVPIE